MTQEEVLNQFKDGYDCAQVVFRYWANKLGFDEKTALKIATGFGAGMLQGETCGAVIGAYLAMGLQFGHCDLGEVGADQKVRAIKMNTQFREKFLEKYPSSICNKLLGADFTTAEGQRLIQEKQLMTTFCPKLVADVIAILEELREE